MNLKKAPVVTTKHQNSTKAVGEMAKNRSSLSSSTGDFVAEHKEEQGHNKEIKSGFSRSKPTKAS